jgi:hypothetical protein
MTVRKGCSREPQRNISRAVERELWGRAAGRCQFSGCNRPLYKSPVTQESVNISQRAHIYSFAAGGPRGRGPHARGPRALNGVGNLMLVCHGCHRTLDQDKEGLRYPAELLLQWKRLHEQRIQTVAGTSPDKKSSVVLYGARIGEEASRLNPVSAAEAMFPDWYPAEERPIALSMSCEHEDRTAGYWVTEGRHLRAAFERFVVPSIRDGDQTHFSVFALAPQPLLILLGTLFTDKTGVEVYQLHREPPTWRWQNSPRPLKLTIDEPADTSLPPVLIVSLSDRVARGRVTSIVGQDVSIWELTTTDPHNDLLGSRAQLSTFRETVRKLMVRIKRKHGQSTPLSVFPCMPVSCAIELGRVRMPKADMPWVIFDQSNRAGGFIEAIRIPGDGHVTPDQ